LESGGRGVVGLRFVVLGRGRRILSRCLLACPPLGSLVLRALLGRGRRCVALL
jgi:hypothetical protein